MNRVTTIFTIFHNLWEFDKTISSEPKQNSTQFQTVPDSFCECRESMDFSIVIFSCHVAYDEFKILSKFDMILLQLFKNQRVLRFIRVLQS